MVLGLHNGVLVIEKDMLGMGYRGGNIRDEQGIDSLEVIGIASGPVSRTLTRGNGTKR